MTAPAPVAAHLVGLGPRWGLWRWITLRSAGFPFAPLLALGAEDLAAEADRLPRDERSDDWRAYRTRFAEVRTRLSAELRRVASIPELREALLWQNRAAARTSLAALGGDTARGRKAETALASYWLRYCAKNDSIGFFGPIGVARWEPGEGGVRPGPRLLAAREVFFEGWCVDAVADALAADERVRPWACPRLVPDALVEGARLRRPRVAPVDLTGPELALLARCDGARTALEVAAEAAEACALDAGRAMDLLADLDRRRLLRWRLETPIELRPERTLRALLSRIGHDELRRDRLAALDRLERARDRVGAAAGRPAALGPALDALETTFTEITGAASARPAATAPVGRALAFEDCRRDVEVGLGEAVLGRLAAPLALLLDSGRWLTWETARRYRLALSDLHRAQSRRTGGAGVELSRLALLAHPLFQGPGPRPVDGVVSEFAARWWDLLGAHRGARRLERRAADLAPLVADRFAAPAPGWRAARYHSPDVMLAARDAGALRRGDLVPVLGELHTGVNTMIHPAILAVHPCPAELHLALAADLPAPRLLPAISKAQPQVSTRLGPPTPLVNEWDCFVAFSPDLPPMPRAAVIPVSALSVERAGDELLVVSRLDGRAWDVVEAFADFLSLAVGDAFGALVLPGHTPRVTVDGLVVLRETWRVPAAEVAGALRRTDEAARFAGLRRWAAAAGLPRLGFVRVETAERSKPFFVDLASPLSARVLRRALGRADPGTVIRWTEMLPEPDGLWLADAEGRRYTSELRLVAVDDRAARTAAGRPAAAPAGGGGAQR